MRLTGLIAYEKTLLQISVSYDEKENEVLDILSVWYSDKSGTTHCLTSLFKDMLQDELEMILKRIDWREIYREEKADKKAA